MSGALTVYGVFGQDAASEGMLKAFGPDLGRYAELVPLMLALALLLWALLNPRVGRVFARIFAVLGIGGGIGVLTWGICAAAMGEQIRSLATMPTLLAVPSEAIGLGAGLLVAGVVALILSFGGCKRCAEDQQPL